MGRRGAVLAGSRAIGTTGRAGVVGQPPGPGASPLARELATGMGLPTQGTAGWGDTYGGYGLPRPASTFTDGAFSPFTPTASVPVDVADASGQPAPRREEYRVGWNLPIGQPGTEGLKLADFNTLRTIADLYSVARACIEFLKSQITSLEWEIMPTKDAAKAMRGDKAAMKDFGERRAQAVKFFKRPDPDYFSWQTWLSDVLEEMLVYDALSVVVREKWGKGQGRGVLGSDLDCLNLISGPTVRPLYDLNGSRPRPPAVAYQQYLYGVPRVDLWSMVTERDLDESGLRGSEMRQFGGTQLLYVPMTPRRWTPYGFSPVERALVPIMTGLQKQAYQLDYFREGTIPGIFVSPGGANADMSPTQIRELQNALNAIAGDPAWKHKILVLPADSRVDPMRPTAVADALDEIVMMQTCMGFGVFPMQVGIMPKVSASQASGGAQNQMAKMGNQQQDRSTTRPKVIFLATLMDYIMTEVCNQDDMRFVFDGMEEEEDEETKTNLIVNQMSHGLLTIDEGRDELGKQPFGEPKTSDPGWGTPTGFQTFQEAEEQAKQQAANAQAMAQNGAVPGQPGAQGAPAKPSTAGGAAAPAKPKPSKPGAGGAGQSPGHESAEASANATRTPAKGDGVSGAPSPKTKAATATATSAPVDAEPTDDPQALRDLVVTAAALGVSQVLGAVVQKFRAGALSLADAVQAGLAALARGYGNVMAMAAEKAWTDGLGDASLDLSGTVARRAETQRPYLAHLLDKARLDDSPADVVPSWLPARVNLYAATLHGAYQEGYGAAVQKAHPEYELVWRLGEAEHCPLCLDRDGQSFTFDTLPGWPGDGGFGGADALCLGGQNCRCSLDYVENGEVLDSGGNTLEQAGYYAQQNRAISAWRADAKASTDAFLAGLPNETGAGQAESVQARAMAREALRRRLASLLNQRVQATGGYSGISFEPSDIPASMVASILPQYGPYPDDVPLTALMDAVDQFFATKGARLDLTKTEFAGIVLGVVADVVKVGPKGYEHGWIFVGAPGVGAAVHHSQHGPGVVVGADHGKGTVDVRHADGTVRTYQRSTDVSHVSDDDPAAGTKKLLAAYHGGHTVEKDLHGGNMAKSVQLVKLSDGRHAVVKETATKEEADKEHLAGLLANAIGIHDLHTAKIDDTHVLTEYVDGKSGNRVMNEAGHAALAAAPGYLTYKERQEIGFQGSVKGLEDATKLKNGREIALLDALTNNTDRHGANWIVKGDTVYPIDHGNTQYHGSYQVAQLTDKPNQIHLESPFSRASFSKKGLGKSGQFGSVNHAITTMNQPFNKTELTAIEDRVQRLGNEYAAAGMSSHFDYVTDKLDRMVKAAK